MWFKSDVIRALVLDVPDSQKVKHNIMYSLDRAGFCRPAPPVLKRRQADILIEMQKNQEKAMLLEAVGKPRRDTRFGFAPNQFLEYIRLCANAETYLLFAAITYNHISTWTELFASLTTVDSHGNEMAVCPPRRARSRLISYGFFENDKHNILFGARLLDKGFAMDDKVRLFKELKSIDGLALMQPEKIAECVAETIASLGLTDANMPRLLNGVARFKRDANHKLFEKTIHDYARNNTDQCIEFDSIVSRVMEIRQSAVQPVHCATIASKEIGIGILMPSSSVGEVNSDVTKCVNYTTEDWVVRVENCMPDVVMW
jgi:hypothetical protein